MCSPICSNTVIGCTYDIPTRIYNMYVYDIEKEDRLSDDWAISSTNITITGLEPTNPSFHMTAISTSCNSALTSREPIWLSLKVTSSLSCSVSMVTALVTTAITITEYDYSTCE